MPINYSQIELRLMAAMAPAPRERSMHTSFELLYGPTCPTSWARSPGRDPLIEATDLDLPKPPPDPLTVEARRAMRHLARKARRAARKRGYR